MRLAQSLSGSERLRHRRFELLPTRGDALPALGPQGRAPGASTAPAELAELISSIAEIGVLQPVLVEEIDEQGAQRRRRLIAGERRLRAVQWGAANLPGNTHFDALPAVVCPGPLTEHEIRVWQLVENLAREDPKPGELAAALLYERCAVLASMLEGAGVAVPADIWELDDPRARWTQLERVRGVEAPQLGAPWPKVLRRLGLQMREETAARLVRAFRTLPPELSSDMDAHGITLATRLAYLRLDRGRQDAANEIWEAVKARGRPDLLAGTVREVTDHPDIEPEQAVELAEAKQASTNDARRAALTRPDPDEPERTDAAAEVATAGHDLLAALKAFLAHLRADQSIDRYIAGSVRLLALELLQHLEGEGRSDMEAADR